MAKDIFYDNLLSTVRLADTSFEQSVETEILLADYDAPVFKIVKTTMDHCVTQKYITKNRLVVEGFIRISIYYQPPGGEKLNVTGHRLPFQKQLDLAAECDGPAVITVTGQAQYVNTRPQNPTRIDIRGAYMFNVKVHTTSATGIVTAHSSPTVCCDSTQLDFFTLTGQNLRQFTLEDELAVQQQTEKIINVHTAPSAVTVAVYKGKITAKGEICADVFYTTQQDGEIHRYSHTFLYNQIIDLPAVEENHIAYVTAAVNSFAVRHNSETGRMTASMTVQLDACAFAKQQVVGVSDAFSRRYSSTKELVTVTTDKNIVTADRTVTAKLTAQVGRDCTVQHLICELSPAKSYFEINKTTVKAKLTAHIIALNSQNEYECFSHSEDVVLPWLENCSRHDEILLTVTCTRGSFVQSGENVSVTSDISATGFIIEKQPVTLLQSFEEDREKPLENREEALILYYAQKGERIFDIAKQHCADPQEICLHNGTEEQVITSPQMLFIPTFEE